MKLSFHGADRGVTGSCHLLDCAGKRVWVDSGLHHGGREPYEENAEPIGFDAAAIETVLLPTAHLDHRGRLPPLATGGAARTFLLRGEEEAMRQFAALLTDTHVEMPAQGQVFSL